MKLQKLLAMTIASVAIMPFAAASAADYDPPIAPAAEEYVPVEVGNGWYLRGDVGYALSTSTDPVTYRTYDSTNGTYGNAVFDTSELNSEAIFGGGIGYRFSDWVRADATIDGFRSRFSGTTSSVGPCPGADPTTSCRSEDAANVSALSFMANGYVDLGTYIGLTPYVGAGAGMSYLSWSDLGNTLYCVGATCTGNPAGFSSHPGLKDWRFTYAFMAGVAYDITKNLKLDVGYKYRNIDGGSMFGWDAFSAGTGASGDQGTDKGLTQQEVRVGLRYELW